MPRPKVVSLLLTLLPVSPLVLTAYAQSTPRPTISQPSSQSLNTVRLMIASILLPQLEAQQLEVLALLTVVTLEVLPTVVMPEVLLTVAMLEVLLTAAMLEVLLTAAMLEVLLTAETLEVLPTVVTLEVLLTVVTLEVLLTVVTLEVLLTVVTLEVLLTAETLEVLPTVVTLEVLLTVAMLEVLPTVVTLEVLLPEAPVLPMAARVVPRVQALVQTAVGVVLRVLTTPVVLGPSRAEIGEGTTSGLVASLVPTLELLVEVDKTSTDF